MLMLRDDAVDFVQVRYLVMHADEARDWSVDKVQSGQDTLGHRLVVVGQAAKVLELVAYV
eukprot:scaffold504709_cov19-Prasinocladus_malaysianus.AAC.1